MGMAYEIAQLRHLYGQMVSGRVKDPASAARWLLSPVIESLEIQARIRGEENTRTSELFERQERQLTEERKRREDLEIAQQRYRDARAHARRWKALAKRLRVNRDMEAERAELLNEDWYALQDDYARKINQLLARTARADARAERAEAECERLRGVLRGLRELRAGCLQTYGGGYRSEYDRDVFRHGMVTVCNALDAAIGRALTSDTPADDVCQTSGCERLRTAGTGLCEGCYESASDTPEPAGDTEEP